MINWNLLEAACYTEGYFVSGSFNFSTLTNDAYTIC